MSEQFPDGVTVIKIFSVPEINALTVRDRFSVSLPFIIIIIISSLLSTLPVRWRLSRLRLRLRRRFLGRRWGSSRLGPVVFLDRNGQERTWRLWRSVFSDGEGVGIGAPGAVVSAAGDLGGGETETHDDSVSGPYARWKFSSRTFCGINE